MRAQRAEHFSGRREARKCFLKLQFMIFSNILAIFELIVFEDRVFVFDRRQIGDHAF